MDKISDKNFKNKNFEEKKEFFEALSWWKDPEVFNYLVKILKTKSFFNRSKIAENKACAAHALGLSGNKDAIPVLEKFKDSGNKLLREFANGALRKLIHER